LPQAKFFRTLTPMEVHFTPETEKKLNDLAAQNGHATADELVQGVIEGYLDELAQTREMLNSRYDDLKSGRVKPIDGEEFFENLRRREDELLKKHSAQ
jgi:predicted DNA-binding protein